MNDNFRQHSSATRKASAVAEIETLVQAGKPVRLAVEEVAFRTGLGERTLFTFLQKTKGIPKEEWAGSLARKHAVPRPRKICPPAAVQRFVELSRTGKHVTVCYRQLLAEAAEKGWAPIPSERTMRRELDRHASSSDRWLSARAAKPEGEL